MKYVKFGKFTTNELSILETMKELDDVIHIAKDIIKKNDNSKELDLALNNLDQAANYLEYLRKKTNIALGFVPKDVQEKEYL